MLAAEWVKIAMARPMDVVPVQDGRLERRSYLLVASTRGQVHGDDGDRNTLKSRLI
jgi:hypothetical protein